MKFQFHNGTINTIPIHVDLSEIVGFNSTTVQLILKVEEIAAKVKYVSIPQRYN